MHYIQHITLTTGHVTQQPRSAISDEAMAVVVQWLRDAIAVESLPVPGVADCCASALVSDGALVVTVSNATPGVSMPLATFGVAVRSRHAANLWEMMSGMPGVRLGLRQPTTPWCAVVPYPTLVAIPSAQDWLGDFERTVAWAWATRNPDIRAAP